MTRQRKVLLASRSSESLRALAAMLDDAPGITCTQKHIVNGHSDPLHDVAQHPDLVVLRFDASQLADLASLADVGGARPPMIVVGPAGGQEAFRLAMRAGARDFLVEPVNSHELVTAVNRILAETPAESADGDGEIIAVVGAAGGVGTSFLACNIAHSLATDQKGDVVVVDLDRTYAPVASYFDLRAERGLPEALAAVESLDEHALRGYITRHHSGLGVLGATVAGPTLGRSIDPGHFAYLLTLLKANFRYIVVDVPSALDAVAAVALGSATHVLLVLQQSVAQARNAVQLANMLTDELSVPIDRMRVVVNRHQKRLTVSSADIERALKVDSVFTIPNAYASALTSLDGGVPLLEHDRDSAVGRAVLGLQQDLRGVARGADRTSLLRRALPLFSRN